MDSFHHPSRSVTVENEDIVSNRKNPKLRGLSDAQVLAAIDKVESIFGMQKLVNYDRDNEIYYDGYADSKLYKVNFTSLSKCGTIEFRQHIATTDPTQNEIPRCTRSVSTLIRRQPDCCIITYS
jgi:hypothetical protein